VGYPDKQYDLAAQAACQILNQYWDTDAPKHIVFSNSKRIILAALSMSAAELRNDMLAPSEN
jgi:hypothetical protein